MGEELARAILQAAIEEGRAVEFLDCLFNGGSATVDRQGGLILASSSILQQLMDNSTQISARREIHP